MTFDAAKNTQTRSGRSRASGMGSEEISETERFASYYRNKSRNNIEQVIHKGSLIGSLDGNVIVEAGGDFLQASSHILANNGKISVSADSIKTITYDDVALDESRDSNLKIGGFAKVSSPLLTLLQQVEATSETLQNDKASNRLKALKTAATAIQSYQVADDLAQGVLARAEVSAGFRYGVDEKRYFSLAGKGNLINAKNGIELTAREGKIELNHTDLSTKDVEGKVNKQGYVTLDAKQGININSGRHEWESKAKQENYGFQAGTGVQVGAQTGWYFFVEAGAGQDKQSSKVHNKDNSHIETGTFVLKSGGDVNFNGASAYAETIKGNIGGKLTINSQQSQEAHKSSSSGGQVRVQGGFGNAWGASVAGHHQKSNAKINQVVEQSGLFAGSGGYDVTANHVHLKGGAISSTNAQQSRLVTNSITFENIRNESSAKTSSFGASFAYSDSNDTGNGNSENTQSGNTSNGNTPTGTGTIRDNMQLGRIGEAKAAGNTMPQGFSMGAPSFASSSQSDAGVTRATLTPGTLILNKDSHPTVTDIKSLGINTELSLANQQVDKPNIDKLKESQEIAALTGQVGSFAVGELGQRMGLEEGSWQKAALHGAVGALSAQLSRGNVKAGAMAGAATEVINTQIANALATHTDLSPQARNNLQQVTAMVAGATAGNLVGNNTNSTVQGANTGLASEVFNRQLHPTEQVRIKELAHQLAREKGQDSHFWEEQLSLVASAMNDEKEAKIVTQGISAILNDTQIYNLGAYKESLRVAYDVLKKDANKNQTIKWKDGNDVILNGEKVHLFQSTEKQYKNSQMFGEINHPITPASRTTDSLSKIGYMNGLDLNASKTYSAELLGNIADANKNRRDNKKLLSNKYYNYVIAPKGIVEPVIWEDLLIGGSFKAGSTGLNYVGGQLEKVLATDKAISFAVKSQRELGKGLKSTVKYAKAHPITTEMVVSGSVATGFDIYNGEASYEKTLANYALANILAGKSAAQQISVNTIYQGVISANNQTKTNDQIARDGIANLMGTSTTLGLEAILNKRC